MKVELEWKNADWFTRWCNEDTTPTHSSSVRTASELSLNGMGLVEIYDNGDGYYEINSNPVPTIGMAIEVLKFRKMKTARKWVNGKIAEWLKVRVILIPVVEYSFPEPLA